MDKRLSKAKTTRERIIGRKSIAVM